MAEESPTPPPSEQPKPADSPLHVSTLQDRTELLARARTFLNSPQILNQNANAKREFLSEKGLTEPEIERLIREPVRATYQFF
jgi:Pex14 N-terminal domain